MYVIKYRANKNIVVVVVVVAWFSLAQRYCFGWRRRAEASRIVVYKVEGCILDVKASLSVTCVMPYGRAIVCRTSTRRANEIFGWQAVSVFGRLPVLGDPRALQKQFPSRIWSTLATRHETSQRDACVEASQ